MFNPNTSFENFEIIAGEVSLTQNANIGQHRKIKDILIHPEHNPFTKENDICLLFIDEDFNLDDKSVGKISLNKRGLPNPGDICEVSGWGRTKVSRHRYRKLFKNLSQIIFKF